MIIGRFVRRSFRTLADSLFCTNNFGDRSSRFFCGDSLRSSANRKKVAKNRRRTLQGSKNHRTSVCFCCLVAGESSLSMLLGFAISLVV